MLQRPAGRKGGALLIGALAAFPVGFVLGVLLVLNLIQVLGWSFLNAGFIALLPPGLSQLAQWVASSWLASSMVGLVLACVVIVLFTFALYWTASAGITIPPAALGLLASGPLERFGRGGLVGVNTALNLVLLLAFMGLAPGGLLVAWTLASINWLAVSLTLSNNPIYQVILAYASLFLPMSLPINLVGATFLAVNAIAAAAGAPFALFPNWARANLITHGGVLHGCVRTAYNLCNYTIAHQDMSRTDPWVDSGTPVMFFCSAGASSAGLSTATVDGVVFHENSHTLNVAAWGWIYHLIGFADEWVAMPWSGGVVLRADAHAELCAESGVRRAGRNWLDAWTPSFTPAAPGNVAAVAAVVIPGGSGIVEIAPLIAVGVTLPRVVAERNRGVVFDSAPSTDPDAGPLPALGHLWQLLSGPPGATAAIATPNASAITFTPDRGGLYNLDFTATDGVNGGPAAGIVGGLPLTLDVLEALITPPTGPFPVGAPVTLVGVSTLTLILGPTLTWTVVEVPAGSGVVSPAPGFGTFVFTPDVAGDYVFDFTAEHSAPPAGGGPGVPISDTSRITITAS